MWKLFFLSTFLSLSVLFLLQVIEENSQSIKNEELDMYEVNQKMLLIEEKFNDLISKIVQQRKALKGINKASNNLNKK